MKNSLKHIGVLLVLAVSVGLGSCKDDTGNPLEKPILSVTLATSRTPAAGDPVTFSIDCTSAYKLVKLKVDEKYAGNAARTVLDSTISTKGFMHAYIYDVPDTATAGQKIALTFTITDEKGNGTTDTEELTVSASRPQIQVTASKTQALPKDTVYFNVTATSSAANLSLFEITEGINGGLGTKIKTEDLGGNQSLYQTNFMYVVPENVNVGQYIVLIFTVNNSEGQSNFASRRIDIK